MVHHGALILFGALALAGVLYYVLVYRPSKQPHVGLVEVSLDKEGKLTGKHLGAFTLLFDLTAGAKSSPVPMAMAGTTQLHKMLHDNPHLKDTDKGMLNDGTLAWVDGTKLSTASGPNGAQGLWMFHKEKLRGKTLKAKNGDAFTLSIRVQKPVPSIPSGATS